MISAYGGMPPPSPPLPPPRYQANISHSVAVSAGPTPSKKPSQCFSNKTAEFKPTVASTWRESVAVIFIGLAAICVAVSSISIFYYAQREKAVYEEIVDYLDKTATVSKINYIPGLGVYEIRANEFETLSDLRKYKTMIWTFLFSDLACYALFAITLFIYYTSDLSRISIRFLFWLFFFASATYTLAEASVFGALFFPPVGRLPNATEELLDHAVPFNTGGLGQIESRLGCIFDQNLYSPFKRRQNSGNTCDPYIIGSFITRTLLAAFVACRAVCAVLFTALALLRNPLAEALASVVLKTRPTPRYKQRYAKNPKKRSKSKADLHTPKSTTFGVTDTSSLRFFWATTVVCMVLGRFAFLLNAFSLIAKIILYGTYQGIFSYNNAAFFATAGSGFLLDSASDLSKCDVPDLVFKESTHTTNSLVSEV